MPRTRRWLALGMLLAAPVLLAQTPLAQTPAPVAAPTTPAHHKSHKTKTKAPAPLVLPPLPAGPLSQVPMDQIPATPAKVSYQGGLLTISAQNSTLGEILRDVRKLTGASIDIPKDSAGASERVIAHLGPGAPRDVLAVLLNGTSFNYAMLGSSSDPTAVASVILTAKPSASGETQTAANVPQNNPGPMPPNRFSPPQPFSPGTLINPQPGHIQPGVAKSTNDDADDKDDDSDNESSADDQPQPAQPTQPAANAQDQQQQPDPNQPNAGPKTPEQVLEMLQRRQPGSPVVPPPQPPQQ
jgi:hypothetical protein